MKFEANINIMPIKEILDPQGKAVKLGLDNLGLNEIDNVRVGKHITLNIEAENAEKAKAMVESACKQLLANVIMEDYKYEINLSI